MAYGAGRGGGVGGAVVVYRLEGFKLQKGRSESYKNREIKHGHKVPKITKCNIKPKMTDN